MYKFYNPNPCARFVGDCVIRAITKAEKMTWNEVYISVCIFGLVFCNMPSGNDIWTAFLEYRGYRQYNLPTSRERCLTVRNFCREYPTGNYIVGTGTHVVAVVDGDYYDSWDSGNQVVDRYFKWQYRGDKE